MASDLQGSTLSINGRAYRPIHASYLAALWTAQNPILQRGEIGIEQDTDKFKIGNGVDRWNTLPYSTGPKGDDGVTFTPFVNSTTGVISWTNDGELPNPDPVNITGPQGETGNTGPYFTPFVNATTGDISWTNNGGLENPETVNIKGPQGETGQTGPQGPQGLVITNMQVADITGIITVTTSSSINGSPTCKALFGGATISGVWTGSGTSWTFTPTTATDILSDSWIITLQ